MPKVAVSTKSRPSPPTPKMIAVPDFSDPNIGDGIVFPVTRKQKVPLSDHDETIRELHSGTVIRLLPDSVVVHVGGCSCRFVDRKDIVGLATLAESERPVMDVVDFRVNDVVLFTNTHTNDGRFDPAGGAHKEGRIVDVCGKTRVVVVRTADTWYKIDLQQIHGRVPRDP